MVYIRCSDGFAGRATRDSFFSYSFEERGSHRLEMVIKGGVSRWQNKNKRRKAIPGRNRRS